MNKNSMLTGTICGLIAPLIGGYLYFLYFKWFKNYPNLSFSSYFDILVQADNLSAMISLAAVSNLPVFYLFYRAKLDHSARGVILASFIYAFAILYLKFLA